MAGEYLTAAEKRRTGGMRMMLRNSRCWSGSSSLMIWIASCSIAVAALSSIFGRASVSITAFSGGGFGQRNRADYPAVVGDRYVAELLQPVSVEHSVDSDIGRCSCPGCVNGDDVREQSVGGLHASGSRS